MTTTAHTTTFLWNHESNTLGITLGDHDNVATFKLASGCQKFQSFVSFKKHHTADTKVVSDNEDDQDDYFPPPANPQQTMWSQLTGIQIGRTQAEEEAQQPNHYPTTTTFNLNGPTRYDKPSPILLEEDKESQPTTSASELIQYHQVFVRISYRKLKKMEQHDIITRHLAHTPIPMCTACILYKATQKK